MAILTSRGKVTSEGLHASAVALPTWAVRQLIGRQVRKHMHDERVRVLVLVLLALRGTTTFVFVAVSTSNARRSLRSSRCQEGTSAR